MKVRVLHMGPENWIVTRVPGSLDERFLLDPSKPFKALGLAGERSYVSPKDELEVSPKDLLHEDGSPVTDGPRFPDVTVKLVGEDGNAFAILGAVQAALRRAGVSPDEVHTFVREATAADYDHLLATVQVWVVVE